jgi:hypothetical protein
MKLKQSTWNLIEIVIFSALSLTLFISAVNDYIKGNYGWVLFAVILIVINCCTIYTTFKDWKISKQSVISIGNSYHCANCDWKIDDTKKNLHGIRCPECKGDSVFTGIKGDYVTGIDFGTPDGDKTAYVRVPPKG